MKYRERDGTRRALISEMTPRDRVVRKTRKERSAKLFHVVVVVGATMTGTAAAIACGSGDDASSCNDPQSSCYAHIGYNRDAYANISDTGGDVYAHIAIDRDANVRETSLDDANDANDASDVTDGADSG